MELGLLLLRLLLAGIFALAGVAKFLDLEGSEMAFKDFGVPHAIAKTSSIALSIFEILIAFLLLRIDTSWAAAVAASSLLVLFIGQMIFQMSKGRAPDCHCFGQLHSEPVGKKSMVRNIIFAALSLTLVAQGSGGQGMSLANPNLDIMQLVFGIALTGLLLAVIFYLKKISEQQTQIMRRIDVIELVARDGASVEREEAGHPHEGLPIGALFPDFGLSEINGNVVSLADLRADKKPTLFIFVGPACNPCKALIPEFEQWSTELVDKLQLVFVSSGTREENLRKFGALTEKTFLLQKSRELAETVKAQWTPTAILMEASGRIASHAAAGDTAIRSLVDDIKARDPLEEFAYYTNGSGHSHTNKIGESIPQFSLSDLKGNEIDAGYFRDRQTLVTFWSLTCPHCLTMMDDLREWDKVKGKDDPSLVVFSDGDPTAHEQLGLISPIVLDEGHKTAAGFGMFGTPSAVLVNENGKIISETAVGAPDIWSLVGRRK